MVDVQQESRWFQKDLTIQAERVQNTQTDLHWNLVRFCEDGNDIVYISRLLVQFWSTLLLSFSLSCFLRSSSKNCCYLCRYSVRDVYPVLSQLLWTVQTKVRTKFLFNFFWLTKHIKVIYVHVVAVTQVAGETMEWLLFFINPRLRLGDNSSSNQCFCLAFTHYCHFLMYR